MAEDKKVNDATPKEKAETKKAKADVCGHINRHYTPSEGLQNPVKVLICTLPAGHAPVPVQRQILGPDKKPMPTTTMEVVHEAPYEYRKQGITKQGIARWHDEAGTELPPERQAKLKK